MQARLLIVLALICLAMAKPAPLDKNGAPIIRCATQDMYELHHEGHESLAGRATCPVQGSCDTESFRDAYSPSLPGQRQITVNMAVHIMESATGQIPDDATLQTISDTFNRLNSSFAISELQFNVTYYEHRDPEFYCIPGYSSDNAWYNAITKMKQKYAVNPTTTMNVFLSCMDFSFQGTLFGIATFPWDSAALTNLGGLYLNTVTVNQEALDIDDVTLEHELGHCFGLYHPFHGSDEVTGCSFPCEEYPHSGLDPAANTVGDFCADTPATPLDYACDNPAGDACNGSPWGTTDYTNFMGYGMPPCGNHFTDQQNSRLRCWTCNAISSLTTSGC